MQPNLTQRQWTLGSQDLLYVQLYKKWEKKKKSMFISTRIGFVCGLMSHKSKNINVFY